MRRPAWIAAAALAAAFLLLIYYLAGNRNRDAQIALGRATYDIRCATCHGKALEGQPNWKTRLTSGRLPAPPHDASGHSWHHPDDVLIGVTKFGLKPYAGEDYESDMPAFGSTLSNSEIAAVWSYIKSTWPERERTFQEEATERAKKTP